MCRRLKLEPQLRNADTRENLFAASREQWNFLFQETFWKPLSLGRMLKRDVFGKYYFKKLNSNKLLIRNKIDRKVDDA